MNRVVIAVALVLALCGCSALKSLKPQPTLVGTWTISGDKFKITGVESATGKAVYTTDRVTFDVVMNLNQGQGSIAMKIEAMYKLEGENYRHTIQSIKPDVTNLVPAAQSLALEQLNHPQVRALLNQIGTAKAKFVSEQHVTISGSDGKTLELRRAS